ADVGARPQVLVLEAVFIEPRVTQPEHERLEPLQADRAVAAARAGRRARIEIERSKRDVIVRHRFALLLEAARDLRRLRGDLGEVFPESAKELRAVHSTSMRSGRRSANEQFGEQ